jgi:3-hydroxymyristoyl/3-hydroxydecanoyl-(acyl carrier protein) dehydratase
VFSSGGPLAAEAARSVERLLGCAPLEVYGSSETGGVAWRQQSGAGTHRWRPLPGVQVRASNGALDVRSRQLPTDGWLPMADVAELHEDGSFLLLGRADRISKIEGKRVSLTAIERSLGASPLVSDVRVVALHEARDVLGAVVVPSEAGWTAIRTRGGPALGRELRATIEASTDRIALPRRWRWVEALPINGQGKTTIAELERLFEKGEPSLPPFRVVEQAQARAVIEMSPSGDLPCFDGHFAGAPVLAGVVQVDWAIELGRRMFGFGGEFLRMEALKFQRVFQPGPPLRIELDWRAERTALRFRFISDAGIHSSGQIFFTS